MRAICSDNGTELKKYSVCNFLCFFGTRASVFLSVCAPTECIIERKNQTLVKMARMMLDEHWTPRRFWTEAINTTCHVSNRIFLQAFLNKTSYELRFGRPPKVSHFRVFGCRCFVLKQRSLDKFESRSSNGVFLGYALHSRAYRVLNLETNRFMETCEVSFDETAPCPSPVFEPAGPDHMEQPIFVEEEHDDADWGDLEPTPPAAPVEPASSTSADGPDPTSSTTWGPLELAPAETGGVEAAVEGGPPLRGWLRGMFSAITLLNR
jgi:hypothetical protein